MEVRAGYKETEVGVIPEDWQWGEVGDFVDLLTGFPFPSEGYSKVGIRLLRGSNVKRSRTDWSDEITVYWPILTADIRKYLLKAGDIIVAMDGSLVGRSFSFLSEADVPALLLQRVARIRSASVDQTFLNAWICSDRFTEHCDAVKTTTAIPHISPADIRSFKIAVPPTNAEQRAIAAALSDADALTASLDTLIAKKRALKQAAMQALLTCKARLPGFTEDWETKRLIDIAPLQRGFDLPTTEIENGPFPVVYSNGILNTHNKFQVKGPGLVTGRSGTIGNVTFVHDDFWPHNTALWVTDFKGNDPRFVFYLYTNLGFERFATGTGVPTLNRNDVHAHAIELPSNPVEQAAIAEVLSDMDAELTLLEAQRNKARALKQSMQQELLTGRIRLV